jgi:hypothetical protein
MVTRWDRRTVLGTNEVGTLPSCTQQTGGGAGTSSWAAGRCRFRPPLVSTSRAATSRSGLALGAGGLVAEGEDRRLGTVRKVELGEDTADVGLDGLLADAGLAGDLAIGVTARDEFEHFAYRLVTSPGSLPGNFRPGPGNFRPGPRTPMIAQLTGPFGVEPLPTPLERRVASAAAAAAGSSSAAGWPAGPPPAGRPGTGTAPRTLTQPDRGTSTFTQPRRRARRTAPAAPYGGHSGQGLL